MKFKVREGYVVHFPGKEPIMGGCCGECKEEDLAGQMHKIEVDAKPAKKEKPAKADKKKKADF